MTEHNTHDFVGHEETDAEVGPLVRFAILLTVVTLVSAALTVGLYKYLDAREQSGKAPRYPLAVGVDRPLPPTPRLQTYPFDDVKGYRTQEALLLDHYAWVDKTAGTVRIPVDRAIELLTAKGLPHRAVAPTAEGDSEEGATQEGATQEGATQEGATQEGATQEGATSVAPTTQGAPKEGATSVAPAPH